MSELREVLERANFSSLTAGGVMSDNVRTALAGFRKRYFVIFVVLFVVCVAVVVLGVVGVALNIREPAQMAAAGGAMGITVGGTIEVMRRVWKEWSQAELIVILIEEAPEDAVRNLLNTLIEKLK
jgi:hypothetical protein